LLIYPIMHVFKCRAIGTKGRTIGRVIG